MSNVMRLAAYRHAAGLGELGYNPPGWDFGGGTPTFNPGGGGGWYQNWGGSLINQAGGILTSIFGSRNNQQQGGGGGLTPAELAALQAQNHNPNVYGTGAITGEGIRIGNSVLSWPVLGLGVLALVLLQSRPLSRR